jgi:hypothetical protein
MEDVINRQGRSCLDATSLHERSVNDNACQPGGKLRATFEAFKITVSGKQRILQRIFGILFVPEDTKCCLKQQTVITAKKSFRRAFIAPSAGEDQYGFV